MSGKNILYKQDAKQIFVLNKEQDMSCYVNKLFAFCSGLSIAHELILIHELIIPAVTPFASFYRYWLFV
jgi:hypothetical protein